MQFWEGAVLLVGGIWLVGRIHRTQVRSLAPAPHPVFTPSQPVPGPTSETNTDGSGYLVSGETLGTGTVHPISDSCPSCGSGLAALVSSGQVAAGTTGYKQAGAIAQPRYQRPMAMQF